MNTVIVKKTSNMQVVEMQITLQDEHHLVNYNKIHEKLQAFASSDKQEFYNQGSDNPRMYPTRSSELIICYWVLKLICLQVLYIVFGVPWRMLWLFVLISANIG